MMGMEDSNILLNLGPLFVFAFIFIPLILLLMICAPLKNKNKCTFYVYTIVKKWLLFNLVIRYIIEGYLDFALSSFVNYYFIRYDTISYIFTSIMCYLYISIIFIIPIVFLLIPIIL